MGAPAVVVGSNRHIAWAFTTAVMDVTDVVVHELSPEDPTLYRTPAGWKRFDQASEVIHVRGATNQLGTVEWTIWGPVLPAQPPMPKRAVRYAAHLPEATNFRLWDMERARDVPSALAIASRCGIPPQNLVVGDRTGAIGWTIAGRLPRRIGFDGRYPVSWADGSHRWEGWWQPEDYPRVLSPTSGRIWSANHRHLGSTDYLSVWVGNGLDARARQIRDDLLLLPLATPQHMFSE